MTPENGSERESRRRKFYAAMGIYVIMSILAATSLDGVLRYAVWILMAGLAAKTLIAYRAGW